MKKTTSLLSVAILLVNAQQALAADSQETIFISAKAPIAAQEFSGAVSVVTAREIALSGATTVAQALDSLPGVSVGAGPGNAQNEIRIRGMAGEYGLILIDGKRVPNAERNISSSPASRSSWVSVENIERIEVIRGAASSLYGADALSGVINIITKKAGDKWRSNVTLSGGDIKGDGGASSGVNLATSGKVNEKVDLSLNLDHRTEGEIVTPEGVSIQSERETTNAQVKLGINLSAQDRVELGVIYGEETADSISNGFSGLAGDNLEQEKTLVSLDYTTKFGEFNSAMSLSLGRDNINDNGTDWTIKDNNIGLDIDGALTDKQYLSGGVSYREESVDRPNRDFSDTFKSTSIYGQDVVDINENNTLTLGFSYEDHSKYDGAFSPKVYWGTVLNEQWGLKLGYSEGRIAPAIREGSSEYVISGGPGRTYQGNDDLKPEESKTTELSLSYDQDSVSGSITLFNSDVKNLITTQNVGGGVNLYSNVNESQIRGLESDISWQLSAATKLAFNYTFIDAVNKDGGANDGNQIADRPKHTANLRLVQNVSAIDASVSLALQGVSSQYTDSANSNEISGYGTIDLGLVKSLNDNLELRANIINLNDRLVLDESDRAIEAGREFRLAITGRF